MAPVIVADPDRPEPAGGLANGFRRPDPDIARRFSRLTFPSNHRADLRHVAAR